MLDIGLFELLIVAVIALLVVGPEQMPALVRTVVHWIQRIRRFINSVQQDIEQDIQAENIQQTIRHSPSPNGQNLTETVKETIEKTKNTLDTIRHHTKPP